MSLQCANCHGQKGVGGVAPTTINGVKVNWKVPPLNTEALRFEEDTDCLNQSRRQPNTICDLSDIITYGRPGTPMQPWGVVGGGPKNDQSIADLVTYIESIQITKEESQAAVAKALTLARSNNGSDSCPEFMTCPGIELANAKKTLAAAKTDLDTKRKAVQKALNAPTATDAELTPQCTAIRKKADAAVTPLAGSALAEAVACGDYPLGDDHGEDRPGRRRLVDRLEATARERERRPAAVRDELCALPHRGMVGVRPDRSARSH